MHLLTGLLTSYLCVSKHYITQKPIDWIGIIGKRYFRILIPLVLVSYLECTFYDYFISPGLLTKQIMYIHNGGSTYLGIDILGLLFIPTMLFDYTFFLDSQICKVLGGWYIKEDFLFCLLTPFILMVYLKSSKVFFSAVILSLVAYQVYAVYRTFLWRNFDCPNSMVKAVNCHVQNFWWLLNGFMMGLLYWEYVLASKIEKFKMSLGYRLLNSVKNSEKIYWWLLATTVTIMIICTTFEVKIQKFTLQIPYNIWSGILMLLALIGRLEIYYKFYGHWLLEIYSNISFEIYLTHGLILRIFPTMATETYQNTFEYFCWILLKYTLINIALALLFKLAITSPLTKITQILFGWDLPSKQRIKSTVVDLAGESKILNEPESSNKKVAHHEKQD